MMYFWHSTTQPFEDLLARSIIPPGEVTSEFIRLLSICWSSNTYLFREKFYLSRWKVGISINSSLKSQVGEIGAHKFELNLSYSSHPLLSHISYWFECVNISSLSGSIQDLQDFLILMNKRCQSKKFHTSYSFVVSILKFFVLYLLY